MTGVELHVQCRRLAGEEFFTNQVTGKQWRACIRVFREHASLEAVLGFENRAVVAKDRRLLWKSRHDLAATIRRDFDNRAMEEELLGTESGHDVLHRQLELLNGKCRRRVQTDDPAKTKNAPTVAGAFSEILSLDFKLRSCPFCRCTRP